MFTALVAFAFYGEHISKRRAVGLVAGFVGVAVLASGKTAGVSVWSAALAGTFAAFLYGIGGNMIRRQLAGIPSGAVAAATLVCASVLLAPFAIVSWPRAPIPLHSWVERRAARRALHWRRLLHLLPPDLSRRRAARRHRDVSRAAVRCVWAWIVLGEPLTLTHGDRGRADSRRRRTEPAAKIAERNRFSPSRSAKEGTVMKTIVIKTCATWLLAAALAPGAAPAEELPIRSTEDVEVVFTCARSQSAIARSAAARPP